MIFNELPDKFKNLKFYFQKIDFFSEIISFNYNESKRLYSTTGICLTVLMIILTTTITFISGKEIYQKNKPSVTQSTLFSNQSYTTIESKTFIMIAFRGVDWNLISNNIMNDLNINGFQYTIKNSLIVNNETIPLNFTYCEKEHLDLIHLNDKDDENDGSNSEFLNNYMFCVYFPQNVTLYNPLRYINSKYLSLYFDGCKNINDSGINDVDGNWNTEAYQDCNEKLKGISFVDIFYQDTYLDPYDYENPIKTYLNNEIVQFSLDNSSSLSVSYKNNEFESDNGFLFTNNYSFKYLEKNLVTSSINKNYFFMRINFSTSMISNKYNRSYLKVQELLASVGGFVNGFIIICRVLFFDFFEFSYLVKINKMISNQLDKIKRKSFKYLRDNYNGNASNNMLSYSVRKRSVDDAYFHQNTINKMQINKSSHNYNANDTKDAYVSNNLSIKVDKNETNQNFIGKNDCHIKSLNSNNNNYYNKSSFFNSINNLNSINYNNCNSNNNDNVESISNLKLPKNQAKQLKEKRSNSFISNKIIDNQDFNKNSNVERKQRKSRKREIINLDSNQNNPIKRSDSNNSRNYKTKDYDSNENDNNYIIYEKPYKEDEFNNDEANKKESNNNKNNNNNKILYSNYITNNNENITEEPNCNKLTSKAISNKNSVNTINNINNLNSLTGLNNLDIIIKYEDQKDITPNLWNYITYRITYIYCCCNTNNRKLINKLKDFVFDIMSIEKELYSKLDHHNISSYNYFSK